MEAEKKIPERSEVREEDKWSISDIYASDELWEADFLRLKTEFAAKAKEYAETLKAYAEDGKAKTEELAKELYAYLQYRDALALILDNLFNYAMCRGDEDHNVALYQGMKDRLNGSYVEICGLLAFEDPFIMKLSDETLEECFRLVPQLTLYRLYIERTRRFQGHILSDREERLLAMAGEMADAPYNIYNLFVGADLKFAPAADSEGNTHPVTAGSYIKLLESRDRQLRRAAFESMYRGYHEHRNTVAAMLAAQVKQLHFYAEARNYASALEAAMAAKEVPVEIYEQLVRAVRDNMNYMYDYIALRKKIMGLEQLHPYDMYVPLVPEEDTGSYTFEEACQLIMRAMAPLGEEYVSLLRQGFEQRWVDRYENVGKQSGAYSSGAKVHPFVLMSFNGNLDSVFTLAHEMGHALHSYLSNRTQPTVYSEYQIFVAEVASTCNEALLMHYLLQNTPKEETGKRKYLLNYYLEQFRTTLYRQTMFAEFEQQIGACYAKGESLTADRLGELYRELNAAYYGPLVEIDAAADIEWARIPHFYYNYYVFQYATGYSAAIALSEKILQGYAQAGEGNEATAAYLSFLSGGCSKTPVELLKMAGVDMTSSEPVESALKLFGELITQLDDICSQI